jgi:hypothetical protein
MLITKVKPVGIDVVIQNVQSYLHKQLVKLWSLSGDSDPLYECYGRVDRNKKEAGYIAEVYIGNNEYKEVYWNDSLKAISWFGISGKTEQDLQNKVDVHLVFFVDLAKIKPNVLHRADEEVRNEIQRLFDASVYGAALQSIELWLENVLREYQGSRRDDRLKAVDMHPIHCFRLNFKVIYDPNIC